MTTFVALGDSITIGVGDPIRVTDPGDRPELPGLARLGGAAGRRTA